ncbi:MAG: hypothetical protein D6715_10820 [Calditrichaeota bacterium]|nr:MAG: hypothetical protein D6715_10820 [Calditrichota bacterium]
MADPIQLQHLQTGSLSAERQYQSQRNLPELQKRLFEAEVLKQFELTQHTVEESEKTERNRIDGRRREQQAGNEHGPGRQKKDKESEQQPPFQQKIVKGEDGTIKHLDVKI